MTITSYCLFLCPADSKLQATECVPNSCIVCIDAHWKGSLRHLSGCEAFLTWRAVCQCHWRLHHNTRQTRGQTGQRDCKDLQKIVKQNWFGDTLLTYDSNSISRMTTALCQESFWGSTGFLLVCQVLKSPPVCRLMVSSQSLHLAYLPAQSALFLSPVKMEHRNRRCRAKSDAPRAVSLLTPKSSLFLYLTCLLAV